MHRSPYSFPSLLIFSTIIIYSTMFFFSFLVGLSQYTKHAAKNKSYLDKFHQTIVKTSNKKHGFNSGKMDKDAILKPIPDIRIQYLNALYEGFVIRDLQNPNRLVPHGEGKLITHTGYLIASTWKHSKLNGNAIVFTPSRARIYCQFLNDKLNGWAVYSSGHSIVCQYCHLDNNNTERIVYSPVAQTWTLSKYDSRSRNFFNVKTQKMTFPLQVPAMVQSDVLASRIDACLSDSLGFSLNSIAYQKLSQEAIYLGSVNSDKIPSGLGILFTHSETFHGEYENSGLEGYGCIHFENGDIVEGYFEQGVYRGPGYKYNQRTNSSQISNHLDDSQYLTVEGKPKTNYLAAISRYDYKLDQEIKPSVGVTKLEENSKTVVWMQAQTTQQSYRILQKPTDFPKNHLNIQEQQTLPKPIPQAINVELPNNYSKSPSSPQSNNYTLTVSRPQTPALTSPPDIQSEQNRQVPKAKRKMSTQTWNVQAVTANKNWKEKSLSPLPVHFNKARTQMNGRQGVGAQDSMRQFQSLVISDKDSERSVHQDPQESRRRVHMENKQHLEMLRLNDGELTFQKKPTEDVDKRMKDIPLEQNFDVVSNLTKKMGNLIGNIPKKRKRIFGQDNSPKKSTPRII